MADRSYLEQNKEEAGGNLYYIDYKCKALIFTFCIVGNCPTTPILPEKKRSEEVEMFLIDHHMHQVNTLKSVL